MSVPTIHRLYSEIHILDRYKTINLIFTLIHFSY